MHQYLTHPVFAIISEVAEEMQTEAFVIGGFVRDLFMHSQSPDIDIVVAGSGIELAKEVAKKIDPKIKVNYFKNFGTAQFVYRGNPPVEFEFVGARKESYKRDSRKPIVEDGTLQDDQDRRDFTINALALSLQKKNFGELIDPFDGIQDLDDSIIRTPLDPNITFSDDPLRMLRGIRFATKFHFQIEEKTWEGICNNIERISIISTERIHTEVNKILLSDMPSRGFRLLNECGLLKIILPEIYNLQGVETVNRISHKDNFDHTLEVVDHTALQSKDLWLRWAALLHDIGKPASKRFDKRHGWTFHGHETIGKNMVAKLFKRLKLPSNEHQKYVQKLVNLHLRPIALVEDVVTDSAVRRLLFDAGDDIDDLMLLAEADITSKNQKRVALYLKNFKLVRKKLIEVEEKDKIRNWQPPISGEIIMKTFGIKPSREVGMIKSTIREAILDCKINNDFDEAFEIMLEEGEKLGLKRV